MEASVVPRWAEGLVCGRCRGGECEMLHLAEGWQTRRCKQQARGRLVICAGPERSGSTWLFNAVRMLLEGAGERVHSYWLTEITSEKLKRRGFGRSNERASLVIKTHEWSDQWDASVADVVLLTERDICGVFNSYLRIGWKPYDMAFLKSDAVEYRRCHQKWKNVAHLVVPFEELSDVGGKELECLAKLQRVLEVVEADPTAVSIATASLPVPSYGGPDPLTKLWPRHIGTGCKERLTSEDCALLLKHLASVEASEYKLLRCVPKPINPTKER